MMLEPFDFTTLMDVAQFNRRAYLEAAPFPHAVIDGVAHEGLAEACSTAFPAPADECWFAYPREDRTQKNKQTLCEADKMPPPVRMAFEVLNSRLFVGFLEALTGIPDLVTDPFLYGGGMHQVTTGGRLEVHVDCDYNPRLRLYRRVTVLWYLSHWLPEYGGALELWEGHADRGEERLVRRAKSIVPDFNRMVIFTNSETSYHGHPSPLRCPRLNPRKSLAVYYFSPEPDPSYSTAKHHKARFLPLPEAGPDPAMTRLRRLRAVLDMPAV